MKKTFALFGFTVALAASLTAQVVGDVPGQRTQDAPFQRPTSRNLHPSHVRIVRAPNKELQIYYITNYTITGSAIPVVMRRYKGQIQPIDSGMRQDDVYSNPSLSAIDGGDFRNTLLKLEPSFIVGRSNKW